MNKTALQSRFTSFVEHLRAFSVLPEADRKEEAKRLEGEYRVLFGAFSKMRQAQVKACMNVADAVNARALAEHLFLGRDQIRHFHRQLTSLNLFSKDPGLTDWALSEFVTRHAAYQLIHKRSSQRTDEETQRLIGAMLGVDGTLLSEDFVKKVKGEMMGAVLAYSHAHLSAPDMERWEKSSSLRQHYGNELGNYLTDCIQAANIPLFYETGEEQNAVQSIACVFVEHGTDINNSAWSGGTAPRCQADAFCVNHAKKLLVVGGATVNTKYNAKQLLSIARHTRALQFLTQNDERYVGYEVRPFVFHGGYFPTDPNAKDGTGIRFVTGLREAGMSQAHIESLARMPFFNMLGEDHLAEDLGQVFSVLNTHVAGCNTLDQYNASETARQGQPRAGAISALLSLHKAAEAMASPAFVLGKEKDGLREALLNGLSMALINFYVAFPVKPPAQISEEEREIAMATGPMLRIIQKKIAQGSGFTTLDFIYDKLADQFSKKTEFNKLIKSRAGTSENKTRLVWSSEIYADLIQKKKVFDLNPHAVTAEALRSVVSELAQGEVSSLLTSAVEHCLAVNESMSEDSEAQLSGGQAALLHQVLFEAKAIATQAKKGKKANPKAQTGDYASHNSFIQTLSRAIGSTEYKSLYDPGLRLTETTFRFARALFQMSHDQFTGKAPSAPMDKALPLFVKECLAADSNPDLQQLALAHVQGIRFEVRKSFRAAPKQGKG